MSVLPVGIGSSGDYEISRSVRFRSSATAYFNRTPSVAGDQTKFTISLWFKRGALTAYGALFDAYSGAGANYGILQLQNDDTLLWFNQTASVITAKIQTNALYRDPSAWYHVVAVYDSTQATAANRLAMYVNGSQLTSFSIATYPTLNQTNTINGTVPHDIGRFGGAANYFDGYLTETNFVDGQALTPSSFGEYDTITGVWKPKKYTGTYGTNGFYLNFSDNSAATAAAIGKDYSGNGNNWTPNNISVTAGTTYDSMLDTPTSFPDGSTGRGNYAVMNPLDNSGATISNGNLQVAANTGTFQAVRSGFVLPTGSWYVEVTATTGTGNGSSALGIALQSAALSTISGASNFLGASSTSWGYSSNGNVYNNNSIITATGVTWAAAAVIGITFDGSTLKFYKNNVLVTTVSSIPTGNYCIASSFYSSDACAFNFGQRPFSYTPPSGFLAVNTQNLPTPTISNGASYMAATTYTGTGAALTIANSANNTIGTTFQPDWVWIKDRSAVASSNILDSVRGVRIHLESNTTSAETTEAVGVGLTAFNSNGFSLGTDNAGAGRVNFNGDTFVAWQWNAGGSTVTNTSGSISAQVRANPTAGFSVITWTGTGANATVGHGLGVAPSMIINKPRGVVDNWISWHTTLGSTGYIYLNLTNASATGASVWNSTLPTSTVFSVGTSSNINSSGQTMVSYCFAAVAGYSAFGSYTGNGSTDGPFIYTGFRPRWIMFKKTSGGTDNWEIIDTSRNTSNVNDKGLAPNSTAAEISSRGGDVLSNGFKLRFANGTTNESGFTYIYAAFAENPFKYSLAR